MSAIFDSWPWFDRVMLFAVVFIPLWCLGSIATRVDRIARLLEEIAEQKR